MLDSCFWIALLYFNTFGAIFIKMRFLAIICSFFICSNIFAQDRPVLQWQKNYGGSLYDNANDFIILADGSFIVLATSTSNDGDITGGHGGTDICVIKMDPVGNIHWQKCYGGSSAESGNSIIQTNDGGFMFIGNTSSNDGDVSGYHTAALLPSDIWIVKLDASGNIMWQKCYGGTGRDDGINILETGSGFLILGNANSIDGDVIGLHGTAQDVWLIRTDQSGNILGQRCYGGTKQDIVFQGGNRSIKQTPDGNFIITANAISTDGDVSLPPSQNFQDAWILKITPTGTMIWDKCIGGNYGGDIINNLLINSDGSFFITGYTYADNLPGSFSSGDGWALQLDAAGNVQWIKAFGGTAFDRINDAVKTPDGGYLLTGYTVSKDGMVCTKHLLNEMWLVKLDATGNVQWNSTFSGSKDDFGNRLAYNSAGECFVLCSSNSTNGYFPINKGSSDIWLTRFSFNGPLSKPSVTISGKIDSVFCTGGSGLFVAVPVDGGPGPRYQWKINGAAVPGNSANNRIYNLQNNDVVSCVLISNDPCIDTKTAVSNNINLKVNPLKPPVDFLRKDTALCSYQRIELVPNSTRFTSYLWSEGSTTRTINVKGPGSYWLQVTDRFQCIGRDSVTIFPKTCIEGVFVPNAFTPNRDGRNDQFMPIMNTDVKAYKFMVYDRWGRVVFQTTTLNKGWDGKVNGLPYDSGVFAWQCQYQLDGEEPSAKRGTVLLLR
jgi:gliding motility-associated-like protein